MNKDLSTHVEEIVNFRPSKKILLQQVFLNEVYHSCTAVCDGEKTAKNNCTQKLRDAFT